MNYHVNMFQSSFSMRTATPYYASKSSFIRNNIVTKVKKTSVTEYPEDSFEYHSMKKDMKPIFNADTTWPYVIGIQEARDVYETCSFSPKSSRADCYLSFGVDQRTTEMYLQIVENYEQLYKYDTYVPNHIDKIRAWFQNLQTK